MHAWIEWSSWLAWLQSSKSDPYIFMIGVSLTYWAFYTKIKLEVKSRILERKRGKRGSI
jgi:hypothetical protein